MSARASLLASSLAAHLVLFGAAAVGPAFAEDPAPATNHADVEANPIDTSMSVRSRFDSKRAPNVLDWKKPKFGRPPAISGDHRQTLTRSRKNNVVRNAIGQPVHQTSIDIKGTDVKGSERTSADGTPNNINRAGNSGTEAGRIDTRRQGFVPLDTGGVVPRDPRINTAINHSVVSGRDIVRRGLSAGVIGGMAKNNSGGISGTDFRPKHP